MADRKNLDQKWRREVYDKAAARSGVRPAPMEPLYTPSSIEDSDYDERLGYPGQYPFTRGVQPTMHRGRFWTMRQYAGFGDAEDANRRYHYLLQSGQTGLSVAFDLPTQMGRDPDHPLASGEVGKVGVSICSLADMETLLRGIPLDQVSCSMTINATASILLCLYAAVAEKSGVPLASLSGTVQNDILKEYMARGTYIYPPRASMRLACDLIAFCGQRLPKWNPISISGYHIREAGATAAQELAFTLADGIAYVDAAVASGQPVDDFAGRLSFFFNVHNHFLEEVAKFRAARRLWAHLMKNRFGAKDPRSWMLRFHAQTAGSTLTAQQPENNIARVTLQALAAVLGGCQSLHTNAWDEALALPTEKSARLALRTQQIIAHESGAADTIDALGGSYALERLTDALEAEAEAYLRKIDDMGGMVEAIAQGFPQREIQQAAYEAQKKQEGKQSVVVGVNAFTADEDTPSGLSQPDTRAVERQLQGLAALKKSRSAEAVSQSLRSLREAVGRSDENVVPFVLLCVKSLATLGEISDVLREAWGQHRDTAII